MITEKQIEIANVLLATGLVEKVFHSCELVDGAKFPAYKIGDEQFYVGPDDSKKMFAYIRSMGAAAMSQQKDVGSCAKMYRIAAPHRIVVFHDHTSQDFDMLIKKLLSVAFISDVALISFNNNAFQLGKQESPIGNFAFDASTFYLAIDVQIKFWLMADSCNDDSCIVYPNPICDVML